MKLSIGCIITLGSFLLFAASSINGMGNGSGDGMSWEQTTIMATVENVMPDSGMVTLRGADGQLWTLDVGQDVDLNNLQQGDQVQVTLYQGQALDVMKPTDQDRQQPLVIMNEVQPPEGINPIAGALSQIRALVTVTNIDRSNNMVTVQGPTGKFYVLKVKSNSIMNKLKKGEQMVVVFTEGIAANIQKQ